MKYGNSLITLLLILAVSYPLAALDEHFRGYSDEKAVLSRLNQLITLSPDSVKMHRIAKTPGGRDLLVLELAAAKAGSGKKRPAVFVAANMEGTVPLATEAALHLAALLAADPESRRDKTWYIMPVGNPDAAARFFRRPLYSCGRNDEPYNDDQDDQVDEDGFEDLNRDGLITRMRVPDPQGEWLALDGESRLMRRADPAKNETGVFKLYSEGIDNDLDGLFNEDGPGGVNVGLNFPHYFKHFTSEAGPWPGSTAEAHAVMAFIMARPEIAMTMTFGSSNFALHPPAGGRRGDADLSRIKIPERFASFMGADTDRTYTLEEVMEMVSRFAPPGMEINESMVAGFLGLGAVVNPLPEDLQFYRRLADEYREFLKKKSLDKARLQPPDARDGSFELWSYYHLGLPAFSMDFWTLPEIKKENDKNKGMSPEQLAAMSNDEFIALGEEKIEEMLRAAGAPESMKAPMLIKALQGGMMTTKRMAEMLKQIPARPDPAAGGADPRELALLRFSDQELQGKGFLPWQGFDHPQLGRVEIGGEAPFAANTPPFRMVGSLLEAQVPWVLQLAGKLPEVRLENHQLTSLGNGLYRLKVWIRNHGELPYPTAMGLRNNRIPPLALTLQGQGLEILEGRRRSLVRNLGGGRTGTVEWLILAEKKQKVEILLSAPSQPGDRRIIELGGEK